jgi:hypothetical protein
MKPVGLEPAGSPLLIWMLPLLLCGLTRFSSGGRWMRWNRLNLGFVDNLRPPCTGCGRPLVLTRIEPEEPGFDLRTYYCAFCQADETIIAAV